MDSVPDPFDLDMNRTIDLTENAVGDNVTRISDGMSTQSSAARASDCDASSSEGWSWLLARLLILDPLRAVTRQ